MTLMSSALNFMDSCKHLYPASRFAKYTRTDLALVAKYLTLSSELYEWYAIAAPEKVSLRWTANELEFFNPARLLEYQMGYRWQSQLSFDAKNLENLEDWQNEWLVIGWIGGDPIIAKTDEMQTPILMAFHGMGDWKPDILSPSLEHFLDFLSAWCKLIEEYKGVQNMFDEDSIIFSEILARLEEITKRTVGERYSKNLMKYLWA